MNEFGRWLHDTAAARGMTTAELSSKLGASADRLRGWLRGDSVPKAHEVALLASALEVSEDLVRERAGGPMTKSPVASIPDDVWAEFAGRRTPRDTSALEQLWGMRIPRDLATEELPRALHGVLDADDPFAALTQGEIQDIIFYAALVPGSEVAPVTADNHGFGYSGTLAIDVASWGVAMSVCQSEFPPEDHDSLRTAALELELVSGRISDEFPFADWLDAIYAAGVDGPQTIDPRSAPRLARYAERAAWITERLRGFDVPAEDPDESFDEALKRERFAHFPPDACYWLLRAEMTQDTAMLERALSATEASRSRLIQSARDFVG